MRIYAPNPTIEDKTFLTAASAIAATALTVANNAGISANDYMVIGIPGREGAELRKVSSVSGNTTINFVGDAMVFAHEENTPIAYIKYNKARFYLGDWSARYSTGSVSIDKDSAILTGTGTSWGSITTDSALLLNGKWYDIKTVDSATQITLTENYTDEDLTTNSYDLVPFSVQTTIDIAVDQEETSWDDTDAVAEDYYRTEYYNSTTTFFSTRSSIISADEEVGFSEYCLKSLLDEIISELPDPERVDKQDLTNDLNDGIRVLIRSVVSNVQEDYLSTYKEISLRANVGEYPLPDDFKKKNKIFIAYDGVNYKRALPMRIADDDPDAQYTESAPFYYIRDNVFGVRPIPTTASVNGVKFWYDRRLVSLKNEGDELPYILRDYKKELKDYVLSRRLPVDGETNRGFASRKDFQIGKVEMVDELADRDLSANMKIEDTSNWDFYE